MSKQRNNIIMVILLSLILAITLTAFFVTRKDEPEKGNDSITVSSEVTSALNVEDIENEGNNAENSSETIQKNFIEPDETEADKILEEKKNATSSTVSNNASDTSSVTKTETNKPTESSSPQSFEDGKTALENKALQYLIEHNIDIKTAGETGENCPHCGKKLWNPDKYGAFIPGMPDDYENSGYCLGTCSISFE